MILAGPICPKHCEATDTDGFLLDFIPFHRHSITETDAKKIKKTVFENILRIGIFDRPGRNQLLYLLSENLINGAIIANISEKDLRRVAESTGKPVFLDGTCKPAETIEKEQCMPIFGHYFQTPPDEEITKILTKPYLLSIHNIDSIRNAIPLLRETPPYALVGEDITMLKQIKEHFEDLA